MLFLWLKALHIIFMVCWFAGIFYLPRLFVNHALCEDATVCRQLAIMEGKLYRFITPFAVLTLVFGLWMLVLNWDFYLRSGWMHLKLALVALLIAYHGYCGHLVKVFRLEQNTRSHVYYRWFNEAPVLILFAVTILVVVRPF